MNSPQSPDRDNTYPEIEIEVEPNDSPRLDPEVSFSRAIAKVKDWYTALPVPARVAVAVIGVFATFSLLTAVLRLVTAVVSLVIMGAVLVLLYRFAIKPNAPK
jgi:multidrug efflux pump subunit AcrB